MNFYSLARFPTCQMTVYSLSIMPTCQMHVYSLATSHLPKFRISTCQMTSFITSLGYTPEQEAHPGGPHRPIPRARARVCVSVCVCVCVCVCVKIKSKSSQNQHGHAQGTRTARAQLVHGSCMAHGLADGLARWASPLGLQMEADGPPYTPHLPPSSEIS